MGVQYWNIKVLTDEQAMREALRLAEKGKRWVHPNPMVGAVLVKNGAVTGKGYHHIFGGPHAEIDLLRKVREKARGGTVYVNLEPCCHYGKTPPCTSALIEAGIKKVVIGEIDPNPAVKGKGIKILREAGISVQSGVLTEECRILNRSYYKYMTDGLPYVTAKIAQSLDGKISRKRGVRTFITGAEVQRETHLLRASHDAVLIGSRTARVDNPLLTVRSVKGPSPQRIVLDSRLRLPLSLQLFNSNGEVPTIAASTVPLTGRKYDGLIKLGVQVVRVQADRQGRVSIKRLLKELAKRNISSLMVEGGSQVFASFLAAGVVDTWYWFVAPKIFVNGLEEFTFPGSDRVRLKQYDFKVQRLKRIGEDFMVEAQLKT